MEEKYTPFQIVVNDTLIETQNSFLSLSDDEAMKLWTHDEPALENLYRLYADFLADPQSDDLDEFIEEAILWIASFEESKVEEAQHFIMAFTHKAIDYFKENVWDEEEKEEFSEYLKEEYDDLHKDFYNIASFEFRNEAEKIKRERHEKDEQQRAKEQQQARLGVEEDGSILVGTFHFKDFGFETDRANDNNGKPITSLDWYFGKRYGGMAWQTKFINAIVDKGGDFIEQTFGGVPALEKVLANATPNFKSWLEHYEEGQGPHKGKRLYLNKRNFFKWFGLDENKAPMRGVKIKE